MNFCYPPMSSIISFKSRVKAFYCIGCSMNESMIQKMKHIRKSIANKRHCFFKVFICNRYWRQRMNESLMQGMPCFNTVNKIISLLYVSDVSKRREDQSQLFSCLGFWKCSQPAHPLSLNMVKTSLNYNMWPNITCGFHNRTMSVHSDRNGL